MDTDTISTLFTTLSPLIAATFLPAFGARIFVGWLDYASGLSVVGGLIRLVWTPARPGTAELATNFKVSMNGSFQLLPSHLSSSCRPGILIFFEADDLS